METLENIEQAIEETKENLISLCKAPNYEEDNYAAGYIAAIEEKTSEIFKAGVEFAQRQANINNIEVINQNKDDYLEIVGNVVINCTTEKSANAVLTILLKTFNEKPIKSSISTFNLWYYYKENTCYYVNDKSKIMIRNKIEFDKENYIIITGEEFIKLYNSQKI